MRTRERRETAWILVLRTHSLAIVAGRPHAGPVELFELICSACGDDSALTFGEVSLRLQRLRGPFPLESAMAEYERHVEVHART